jgi:Tfp pilus assembly protein PilN
MRNDPSFLPEDYVTAAAERRTNLLSLTLFATVMVAVFAAFLVTNRQWTQVRTAQLRVNGQMEKATVDIRKMRELETRRGEMVDKAELATTLIEPVPRSVLLALLAAAMPERLSLVELDLRSEEIKLSRPAPAVEKAPRKAPATATRVAVRGKAAEAAPEKPKVDPTRYLIAISLVGLAADDLDVSRFLNSLGAIPILKGVRLDATESKEIAGRTMRQFRISMRIEPDANLRTLGTEPIPAPQDPMRIPSDTRAGAIEPVAATNGGTE